MGPDGEWIRDEATSAAGSSGGPDSRSGGPAGDGAWDGGPAWDGAWGHGGVPGFSVRAAAAVAVLAAAAGVATGLFLIRGAPAASMAGQATPSASASAGTSAAGSSLPRLPGLPGHGNGQLQMILTGRVLAVSGTSITIGGEGPSVTAAVTGATKVIGTARGIEGVKAGDDVSAQITGTTSHLTATAIQDPAGSSSAS